MGGPFQVIDTGTGEPGTCCCGSGELSPTGCCCESGTYSDTFSAILQGVTDGSCSSCDEAPFVGYNGEYTFSLSEEDTENYTCAYTESAPFLNSCNGYIDNLAFDCGEFCLFNEDAGVTGTGQSDAGCPESISGVGYYSNSSGVLVTVDLIELDCVGGGNSVVGQWSSFTIADDEAPFGEVNCCDLTLSDFTYIYATGSCHDRCVFDSSTISLSSVGAECPESPEQPAAPPPVASMAARTVERVDVPQIGNIARNVNSQFPQLWRNLKGLWLPMLGNTGFHLHNMSSNNHHGTLENMPFSAWEPTNQGVGINFTGNTNNERVAISDDGLSAAKWLGIHWAQISTWVLIKFNSISPETTGEGLIARWGTSGGKSLLMWRRNSDNKIGFRVYNDGGSNATAVTDFTVVPNTWYNVVGTYDGSRVRIFVDGVKQASDNPLTGIVQDVASEPLLIGSYDSDFYKSANGIIVGVGMWDRALNYNERYQLYVDPLAMVRGKLVQ